jgi:2-iminobutanoate/2-iminopropanoate deaminase
MKKLLLFPLLVVAKMALAQVDTSVVKFVNPTEVATPKGYSNTVQVDLGTCKMILIAGQVAFDNKGNLVGPGDFGKQAEQVFTNIKNIIESAGGTIDNVVKLNFYILDVNQLPTLRSVRDKFVNTKNPPVSTLVQVSKLFRDDVLIEIETTAIIPKKK